jgi:hypothetical protein
MPRKKPNNRPAVGKFTLKDAMDFIDNTSFADNTKTNFKNNLTNLMAFSLADEEQTFLPIRELQEEYADYDLLPLVKDYDQVEHIIENLVISRRDGKPISIDTKKQLYYAVTSILTVSSPIRDVVGKETRELYDKKSKGV